MSETDKNKEISDDLKKFMLDPYGSTRISWCGGNGLQKLSTELEYDGFRKDGQMYSRGDYAYIITKDHTRLSPIIGRIEKLYQSQDKKKKAKILFFYRIQEIPDCKTTDLNAVFSSTKEEIVDLSDVQKKCIVETKEKYAKRKAFPYDTYYIEGKYEPKVSRGPWSKKRRVQPSVGAVKKVKQEENSEKIPETQIEVETQKNSGKPVVEEIKINIENSEKIPEIKEEEKLIDIEDEDEQIVDIEENSQEDSFEVPSFIISPEINSVINKESVENNIEKPIQVENVQLEEEKPVNVQLEEEKPVNGQFEEKSVKVQLEEEKQIQVELPNVQVEVSHVNKQHICEEILDEEYIEILEDYDENGIQVEIPQTIETFDVNMNEIETIKESEEKVSESREENSEENSSKTQESSNEEKKEEKSVEKEEKSENNENSENTKEEKSENKENSEKSTEKEDKIEDKTVENNNNNKSSKEDSKGERSPKSKKRSNSKESSPKKKKSGSQSPKKKKDSSKKKRKKDEANSSEDEKPKKQTETYKVGDYVWAKIKSWPWWPGMVVSLETEKVSKTIIESRKKNTLLIKFFGSRDL